MSTHPSPVAMDVTPLVQHRGMGRYVSELLRALRMEGVHVVGSVRTGRVLKGDVVRYLLRARREGVRAFPAGFFRLPGIQQWIRVFHAVEPAAYMPGPLPTVVTFHDLAQFRRGGKYSRIAERIRRTPPERVVAVSHYTAREVRRAFPELADRIRVVHHGVRTDLFRPRTETDVRPLLRQWGLAWNAYFLFAGEADDRKNLQVLARVVQDPRLPPLVMVGTSAERLASYLDPGAPGIRLLGPQPLTHLVALYAGARALLFPSIEEGFGFPVLEAMACGTLVVTTPLSALPEVGGDVPLYLPPDDPEVWYETVRALASGEGKGERERLRRGRERALTFSWTRTARATLEVYQEAVHEATNQGN